MSIVESLAALISSSNFIAVIAGLSVAVSVSAFLSRRVLSGARLRYSHKIAVIGFPGAGKTTMISMMFSRLMRTVIARNIRVSGKETIARISELHERIISGRNVGPSTDKDVFSYRFQVDGSSSFLFFRRDFDVEIADFPGEYSDDLAAVPNGDFDFQIESLVSPIGGKPTKKMRSNIRPLSSLYGDAYQTWVALADEYVIVLDLEAIIGGHNNRSIVHAKMLRAVLSLKESSIEGGSRLSDKDVALVFSKSDIIASQENEMSDYRANASFLSANSDSFKFDKNYMEVRQHEIIEENHKLIGLLRANFGNVLIVFHSSYSEHEYFERSERSIIDFVMPGRSTFFSGKREK